MLNLGGPDSLEAVKPFLCNLFSDRDIIRLGPPFLQGSIASLIIRVRLKKTIDAYRLIGGKSPLAEITSAQAEALESSLNSGKGNTPPNPPLSKGGRGGVRVHVGMRYWHPFIEGAVRVMADEGVDKIVALTLYPHYSIATTGSSVKKFEEVASRFPLSCTCITSWFDHPGYIDALVEKIVQGLEVFKEKPAVLFSAHSLPQKIVDAGDPYVREIRGTIDAVTKKLDVRWYLSYQSKTGPVKWLEPTTEHMLHELAGKGVKDLLVVPISFVSDHIETLYEIDILYKDMARKLGINLMRTESLNTSPGFIEALADIVVKGAEKAGWKEIHG
ncbi:MAG TPA: ferrochelatase [Dissulfurispiraceae bacterium]